MFDWLRNLLADKREDVFKIRIKAHGRSGYGYYSTQYYMNGDWHYIHNAIDAGHTGHWNPVLFEVNDAEAFARKFTTLEDVIVFEKKEQLKYNEIMNRITARINAKYPFESKEIL